MKKTFFVILTAVAITISPLASTILANSKMAEIEEAIICLCGCGQTVKNCPHQNCGFAIPARTKIEAYLNEGKTKEEILDIFVSQNGEEVLATPKKEGFNWLGYLMPFIALFAAAAIIILVIKGWTKKGLKDEEETLPMTKKDFGSDIEKKLEEELEEMD